MDGMVRRHTTSSPTPDGLFRLSVEQYHAMIRTGVLTEDDDVELIDGVLVQKMPRNPPHRNVTRRLAAIFGEVLPDGWFYLSQEAITLEHSEPEPDGMVVRGVDSDYSDRNPAAGDVALVIEVADTTLERDLVEKLAIYARGGVATYWVVDLNASTVHVFSEADPLRGSYTFRTSHIEPKVISFDLDDRTLQIPFASVLPG